MSIVIEILPLPGHSSLIRGFLGIKKDLFIEGLVRVRNTVESITSPKNSTSTSLKHSSITPNSNALSYSSAPDLTDNNADEFTDIELSNDSPLDKTFATNVPSITNSEPPKPTKQNAKYNLQGIKTITNVVVFLNGKVQTQVSGTIVKNNESELLNQSFTLIGHPSESSPFYQPDDEHLMEILESGEGTVSSGVSVVGDGKSLSLPNITSEKGSKEFTKATPIIIATGGLILQAGESKDFMFSFCVKSNDEVGSVILPTLRTNTPPGPKSHFGNVNFQVSAICNFTNSIDRGINSPSTPTSADATKKVKLRERLIGYFGPQTTCTVTRDLDIWKLDPRLLAKYSRTITPISVGSNERWVSCSRHHGFTFCASNFRDDIPSCNCAPLFKYHSDDEDETQFRALTSHNHICHPHPLLKYSISMNRTVLTPADTFDLYFKIEPKSKDNSDGNWVTITSIQLSIVERQKVKVAEKEQVYWSEDDVEVLKWERKEKFRGEFAETQKVTIPLPTGPPSSETIAKLSTPSHAAASSTPRSITSRFFSKSLPSVATPVTTPTMLSPTANGPLQKSAPPAQPIIINPSFSMTDPTSESGSLTVKGHINPTGSFKSLSFHHYIKIKLSFASGIQVPESSSDEFVPSNKESDDNLLLKDPSHLITPDIPQPVNKSELTAKISNFANEVTAMIPVHVIRVPNDRFELERILLEKREELEDYDRFVFQRRREEDSIWRSLILREEGVNRSDTPHSVVLESQSSIRVQTRVPQRMRSDLSMRSMTTSSEKDESYSQDLRVEYVDFNGFTSSDSEFGQMNYQHPFDEEDMLEIDDVMSELRLNSNFSEPHNILRLEADGGAGAVRQVAVGVQGNDGEDVKKTADLESDAQEWKSYQNEKDDEQFESIVL